MTSDTGADDTKQRIIEAALRLFGEVGFTRATTRAIAEKAGVNEVTLFRHFGNKKTLLLACIRAGNQTSFSYIFREHLSGDYAADIRMMARLQMEDTRRSFEVLRLLLCDAQAVPDLRELLVLGAIDNRERLATYFAQQIEAGNVRGELNPLVLAHGFDSLFSSYVLFEQLMGSAPLETLPDELVMESLVSVFIQGTQAHQGG
ncbi:MAG: TetR/AcrR family transcriptional regulator [Anaerolineae bacterium]|nr:TetR/AcrR family transcriptional regulator [Anaerolineae bacterium]